MSFEQGQAVRYTHGWYGEVEATILAVLPEGSKYQYVLQYTDDEEDDGLSVDLANDDELKHLAKELTLTEEQLTNLYSILRVAWADHADKFPTKDCRCLENIQEFTELVAKSLGVD